MVWFQVDDGMWSHPKMLGLSAEAGWLWVRAGAYCAQHLTDGVIPPAALRILGAEQSHVDELVAAGLWLDEPGGYRFHDWHIYQRTREKVEADRAAARDRQAKVRAKKAESVTSPVTNGVSHAVTSPVTNGVTNGVSHGVSHASLAEPNRAEPSRAVKDKDTVTADAATTPPAKPATYPADFEEFWAAYPNKRAKGAALNAYHKARKIISQAQLLDAVTRFATDPNLPADKQFIPHAATWLNERRWDDEPYSPPVGETGAISAYASVAAALNGQIAIDTTPRLEIVQ